MLSFVQQGRVQHVPLPRALEHARLRRMSRIEAVLSTVSPYSARLCVHLVCQHCRLLLVSDSGLSTWVGVFLVSDRAVEVTKISNAGRLGG